MKTPIIYLIPLLIISCQQEKSEEKIIEKDKEVKEKTPIENTIAFSSNRDGNYEIYLMDSEGKEIRNISNHESTDYKGSWSSDGEIIYFYSDRTGNNEIFSMRADGSDVKQLTDHKSNDYLPMSSPDGKYILFVSERDHNLGEIYRMNSDGTDIIRITNNTLSDGNPSWSPDGKNIIFTRELITEKLGRKASNGELFLIDSDLTNERQLTNKEGFDSGPSISPDGKKIAFHGQNENEEFRLYIMNMDGTGIEMVGEDSLEYYSPTWSPDGKFLAYTKGNSENYDIWKLEISTGKETRLTEEMKRDESPFWRPMK